MELAKESKSISVFEIRRNKIICPPEYLQAEELVSIALISRQLDDLDLNNKSSTIDNCVEVLIKNASFQWNRILNINEIFDVDSDDDDELDMYSEDEKRIDAESVDDEVYNEDEKTNDKEIDDDFFSEDEEVINKHGGNDNDDDDDEEESDIPLDNKTIQVKRLVDKMIKENEWNEHEIDKLQLVVHNKEWESILLDSNFISPELQAKFQDLTNEILSSCPTTYNNRNSAFSKMVRVYTFIALFFCNILRRNTFF